MTATFFANPEFRAKTLARIPLGRLGEVEDLMGAIAFLATLGADNRRLPHPRRRLDGDLMTVAAEPVRK